ncbi:MAG TPA: MoaD/ThiS family protein [Spirochaetota bacterium]|nr:MoaD/ThiS family protein [Spirochaetota bacterium]HPC43385.1 MoaD/ThiS family protein [Spirochaetota bacterium]HPL18903.1 MoaD/ThiS family protein [Spirochaetota bacterium]HQF07024.1 MoaD/ThiS family protein [Spirochaetota bacterium]HQH95761.1 MoaD/ThiS family protein [Spirochaetota bacterium]
MAGDFITIGVAGKGPVRKYISRNKAVVPSGSTVSTLIAGLRLPAELRVICMRDGKRMPPTAKLNDGDSVIMISMVAGG